jgi:hypothetical protein
MHEVRIYPIEELLETILKHCGEGEQAERSSIKLAAWLDSN